MGKRIARREREKKRPEKKKLLKKKKKTSPGTSTCKTLKEEGDPLRAEHRGGWRIGNVLFGRDEHSIELR